MGKSLILFIKYQKGYFFYLLILFVLPLGLLFQFSPYPVHKIQYIFLATLLASQSYYYRQKDFYRKIESKVTGSLKKELRRTPSLKEISSRSVRIEQHRSICIGLATTCIFLLMLYFQEF
jgi:hypothetical protein